MFTPTPTRIICLNPEPQKNMGKLPKIEKAMGSSLGIACRETQGGVEIISVIEGSPASKAGIAGQKLDGRHPQITSHNHTGDTLTAVFVQEKGRERRIPVTLPKNLAQVLNDQNSGDAIKLEYICSNTHKKSVSKPVRLDKARGVIGLTFDEGYAGESLPQDSRVNLNRYPGFPAKRAGIQNGDLISSITINHNDGTAPTTLRGSKKATFLEPGGEKKSYDVITLSEYKDLMPLMKAGDSIQINIVRPGSPKLEAFGGFLGFNTSERTVTPVQSISVKMEAMKRPDDLATGQIFKL